MKYSSRCAIYWQLLHGWGVAWLNEIQLSMLWHACSILKEMPFNLSLFRKTEVDAMAKIDLLGLLFIRSRSLCLFHYKKKKWKMDENWSEKKRQGKTSLNGSLNFNYWLLKQIRIFAVRLSCSKNIQKCLVLCTVSGDCVFSDVGLAIVLFSLSVLPSLCKHWFLRGSKTTPFYHQYHLVAPLEMLRPTSAWGWHWKSLWFFSWCSIWLSWLRKKPKSQINSSSLFFFFQHFHFLVPTFKIPNVPNCTYYSFTTVLIINHTHAHISWEIVGNSLKYYIFYPY